MSVRQTDLPDVYEVMDGVAQWTIACLPTLVSSRALRELFHNHPLSAVRRMRCKFNVAFQKWEPTPNSFPQTGIVEDTAEDGSRQLNTAAP